MTFKIITPRPELLGKIDRRDLLKLSAMMGSSAMLPRSAWANDYPPLDADNPPSANQVTPEANIGGLFDQGVMPDNRLIMYYGFPQVDTMGILGEYEPAELLPLLDQQAEEYRQATTDGRGWRLGFELIGSVAQREPGPDGMYVADTDGKWLDQYTIFTHENDMELVIDVQMGRKKPHEDYEGLERWLRYPHVHLAIDPEFHLAEDDEGIPGENLGKIHADDVTRAQNWITNIADKYGTPRKILIIHQFVEYSVVEKDLIQPMDTVDLVMNCDGHGSPNAKLTTYDVIITRHPIHYNGFKLFYREDTVPEGSRLMTAEEVMAMNPVPDVINYQ